MAIRTPRELEDKSGTAGSGTTTSGKLAGEQPGVAAKKRSKTAFLRQLPAMVSRSFQCRISSIKTLVCLVSASRLSGGEGRRTGFGPSGDQGQPGQASVAVERLANKPAVIEATGVLR